MRVIQNLASRAERGPVFVSYRQGDGTEQRVLVDRLLRTAGIPTWVDQDALFAGDLRRSINNVIATKASGAVVLLTPSLAEEGNFVMTHELPAFCAMPDDFWIAIVNTVTVPGRADLIDDAAPARFITDPEMWKRLDPEMRYQIDTVQHRERFVRGVVGRRGVPGARTDLVVGIQTRPGAQGANPEEADFDFRLRANDVELPDVDEVLEWTTGVQIVSNRSYTASPRHLRIIGGAHTGVAAALGAAFCKMKFPQVTVHHGHLDDDAWPDPQTAAPYAAPQHDELRPIRVEPGMPSDAAPGDVAILVRCRRTSEGAPFATDPFFSELIDTIDVVAHYVVEIGGPNPLALPPAEGCELAPRLAWWVRQLAAAHRGRAHLCLALPFPLAVLLGRRLNVVQSVVYDLNKDTGPDGRISRRYEPIALAEANAPGNRSVLPLGVPRTVVELDEAPLAMLNLTPHAVTWVKAGIPAATWPASGRFARIAERIDAMPPISVIASDAEGDTALIPDADPSPSGPVGADSIVIDLDCVHYGDIIDLPEPQPGTGYLVSRIVAERVRRPDLFFPSREVRDQSGQIIGCSALGQFTVRD